MNELATNGTHKNGSKKGHAVAAAPEVLEKESVSEAPEEKVEAPSELITREERVALFQEYSAAVKAREDLEAKIEAAKERETKAVSAIVQKTGKTKFSWQGRTLTAVKNKNNAGYSFRGAKVEEIEVVE